MSANVETMFSVREKPWHGLGTIVEEAPTSREALEIAGLDWTVEKMPVYAYDEANNNELYEIPQTFANVRSSDHKSLGIVTGKYKIVQNTDAFEFTDNLIGGSVHYETAGSLNDGKRVWLMAKMENTDILGDEIEPYLVFTNTFDGSGAIRACMTPIRVVCNNTLNFALEHAKRQWRMCHMGKIDEKIEEARTALGLAELYMKNLKESAEILANTKVDIEMAMNVLKKMKPIKEDDSDIVKARKKELYDNYTACWFAPDLAKFIGTGWGAINAISDLATHKKALRQTDKAQESVFSDVLGGHPMIDEFVKQISANACVRI